MSAIAAFIAGRYISLVSAARNANSPSSHGSRRKPIVPTASAPSPRERSIVARRPSASASVPPSGPATRTPTPNSDTIRPAASGVSPRRWTRYSARKVATKSRAGSRTSRRRASRTAAGVRRARRRACPSVPARPGDLADGVRPSTIARGLVEARANENGRPEAAVLLGTALRQRTRCRSTARTPSGSGAAGPGSLPCRILYWIQVSMTSSVKTSPLSRNLWSLRRHSSASSSEPGIFGMSFSSSGDMP